MVVHVIRGLCIVLWLLLGAEAAINNGHKQQQTDFGSYNNPFHHGATSFTTSKPNIGAGDKDRHPYKEKVETKERYNHRYPDGSYEFRYELTDGTARYERGYFLLYDKVKTLVVVGYYSYRMPDGRYITVFYNADQNGYRQNQSITPQTHPNLPRSIDVPELRDTADSYSTVKPTTPNPKYTATTYRGRF